MSGMESRHGPARPTAGPGSWIGLVEVEPTGPGAAIPESQVAFVTVIARCASEEDFLRVASESLGELQLRLVAAEEIEELAARLGKARVEARLLRSFAALPPQAFVAFGTFHCFPRAAGRSDADG